MKAQSNRASAQTTKSKPSIIKRIMSTASETQTEVTTPAPAPVVEAPKPIIKAVEKLAKAQEGERTSYRELAAKVREFGKSTTLSQGEIRTAIAKALAQGFGVDLEVVETAPKAFQKKNPEASVFAITKNKTLYPLRSTLCGIAKPADEARAAAVDQAIEDNDTTWGDIVSASRGSKSREGRTTDGTKSKDEVKPLTEGDVANKIGMIVAQAAHAEIPAQVTVDVVIAALQESVKQAYPNSAVKFSL